MTGTEPVHDDAELVRLAQHGDADAFGVLVDRHRRAVYRAAYAALGSPAEADDAAQDAFITAYRKLAGFRGDASFRTWLLAIAWRKALDRRRVMRRWLRQAGTGERFASAPDGALDLVPAGGATHEERLAAAQLRRQLQRLIAALPRTLRDTLLLAASGDCSYEVIARMLHVPVGTVKWRVSEARRVLRTKLLALGYRHG